MRTHTRLQVLYDPLSYTAGWESVTPVLAPRTRSALNAALMQQHALAPPDTAESPEQAQWAERVMRHWACVPAAAYLMACSMWRGALSSHRMGLVLEPQVHTFNRFDFPTRPLPAHELPRSPAQLLHWGGRFVSARLPVLPPWLAQRLQLRFRNVAHGPFPPATPWDETCFLMALAHAQKDPRFCRRVRT